MDQLQSTSDKSGTQYERTAIRHGGSIDYGQEEVQSQPHQVIPMEVTSDIRVDHERDNEMRAPEVPVADQDAQPPAEPLTRRQMLNLLFCLLAWACTIANVTLGT